MPDYTTLEIAICDYCNLNCKLCSQGTPLQKNKSIMSLEMLQDISGLMQPDEFDEIKISGGEPTLHPDFVVICQNLRKWFSAKKIVLATNGARLLRYKDVIDVFDEISLSLYPGKNDAVFEEIIAAQLPNVNCGTKNEYQEMVNVFEHNNMFKNNVPEYCQYAHVLKIAGDRIYKCCIIFGQSIRYNINVSCISVELDANWKQNLAKIDLNGFCQRCFVDVTIPSGGVSV